MKRARAWGLGLAALLAASPLAAVAYEAPVGRAWTRAYYLDNTASAFLRFWDTVATASPQVRLSEFRARFVPAHPDALAMGPMGPQDAATFYRKTLPTFFAALDDGRLDLLRARTRAAETAIPRLANRLQTVFATGSLRLDRPFVLGLGFGASQSVVALLRDRPTLMIPADGLIDEGALEVRLAADMYRLLRADIRQQARWDADPSLGQQAFEEGAARYFAYEQIPSLGARDALGYSASEWATALAQQHGLALAILRHFESSERPYLEMYGPQAEAGPARPPRSASFVGYLALERLRRLYGWDEIIRWDPDTVRERMLRVLTKL